MLQEVFNNIRKQYDSKLPFVAYRKPNDATLHFVYQQDDTLYKTVNFTESGFVFSPFNSVEESVLIPFENNIQVPLNDEALPEIKQHDFVTKEVNGDIHINLVTKGIEAIHNETFKKVVLSRSQTMATHKDPINLLLSLLKLYPTAFIYLWFHPKVGCWLAATPERFLSVKGRMAKTMALAGTQPYGDTIVWTQKEKEEQQLVTDFIIEATKPLVTNTEVSDVQTVKAGNLAHLRTDINLNLSTNTSLKDLVEALHPTPAVCGLPKEAAKAFILKNEDYNRGFYTGFLGELNKATPRRNNLRNVENKAYRLSSQTSDLFVNLRCMQLKDNTITLYVGGGITASSNPIAEFEETVKKAQTMIQAIQSEKI